MIHVAMGLSMVDGFSTFMILFGGMVSMCAKSKTLLRQAKGVTGELSSKKEKMLNKKLWRSCDKIKVKFGDNNFLEELTPLRCLNASAEMTVQCMLLSSN